MPESLSTTNFLFCSSYQTIFLGPEISGGQNWTFREKFLRLVIDCQRIFVCNFFFSLMPSIHDKIFISSDLVFLWRVKVGRKKKMKTSRADRRGNWVKKENSIHFSFTTRVEWWSDMSSVKIAKTITENYWNIFFISLIPTHTLNLHLRSCGAAYVNLWSEVSSHLSGMKNGKFNKFSQQSWNNRRMQQQRMKWVPAAAQTWKK